MGAMVQRPRTRTGVGGTFIAFWWTQSWPWVIRFSTQPRPGTAKTSIGRGMESSTPPGPISPVSTRAGI